MPTHLPARSAITNAIRALAMDAVQKANSGHPGAPMGMAPMAYVLWTRFLVKRKKLFSFVISIARSKP